jgi:hypothetical protein
LSENKVAQPENKLMDATATNINKLFIKLPKIKIYPFKTKMLMYYI